MPRKSYLALIREQATPKAGRALLMPPKVLFRPIAIPPDFGADEPIEAPSRARPARAAVPDVQIQLAPVSHPAQVPAPQQQAISLPAAAPIAPAPPLAAARDSTPAPKAAAPDAPPRRELRETILLTQERELRHSAAQFAGASRKDRAEARRVPRPQIEPGTPIVKPPMAPPVPVESAPPPPRVRAMLLEPGRTQAPLTFTERVIERVVSNQPPASPLAPRAPQPREAPHNTVRAERERGRVHIGTLELRILPPPSAPREVPAPAAAARRAAVLPRPPERLARGFGFYGLSQS